jgi:hypothetical protein
MVFFSLPEVNFLFINPQPEDTSPYRSIASNFREKYGVHPVLLLALPVKAWKSVGNQLLFSIKRSLVIFHLP